MNRHHKTSALWSTVANQRIRGVVDRYPEVMPLLARHGINLCCGGEHTIAEAVRLHALNPDTIVTQIEDAVAPATATR
jgi:iron-sulfur cluster repair protein YtfE (RIC family)